MPTDFFPTTAIVLAGGFGTRLQSVVRDVAKPMAPIGERPFITYVLDWLAEHKVERVILAVGHLGGQVETALGVDYKGLQLVYSHEAEPLGTGGAVLQAFDRLPPAAATHDVFVVNGDTYFDCDLRAFAKTHLTAKADVSIALHDVADAGRYGLVGMDSHDRITAFAEKTAGSIGFINAGVYLMSPLVLAKAGHSGRFSMEQDFFEKQTDKLHLQGVPLTGYFIDIGVPEDYARAQSYFAEQT